MKNNYLPLHIMHFFVLFPLLAVFFACAPLPSLAPSGGTPTTLPEQSERDKPQPQKDEPPKQAIAERQFVDVGIGFEKAKPKIECKNSNTDCLYNGKNYRGEILVLSADTGNTVINRIAVEDYLKGVVPHEIGKLGKDGFEALKAQAVAARTYAYHHLGSRKSLGFDVFADTRDQVYNGRDGEDSLVNAAILGTQNLVIKYKGKLIEAFYHSTCGGNTDSPEVWGQEQKPYLVSVSDLDENSREFCYLSKYMSWEEKFSDAELVNFMQKNTANARADKIFAFGKIDQIFVTEKFKSGRIKRLVVFTDKGSFEVFGDRVRWLFARDGKILPSALFEVSHSGKEWKVAGKGSGHGIGMCQMGAIARAKAGQNFEQILKAYFTDVMIENISFMTEQTKP
ncbi:hypothetical protein AGMMS49938_17360 [Fibrobacterales bacterium]|nr:hypothetical protein AGMMS49938_17360 [Fibrobacterales bacterium]